MPKNVPVDYDQYDSCQYSDDRITHCAPSLIIQIISDRWSSGILVGRCSGKIKLLYTIYYSRKRATLQ
jgi:hypothetical protein